MSDAGLTIGSLFAGIGGLDLGLERAGLGPVLWQAEIDPFCRRVLAKHWPDARRYEDVREVDESAPRVGVLCGGFPCQDLSHAGKRAGLAGERSGLWFEFLRVVGELRPGWVLVENVHQAWRKWVPVVRGTLGRLGYASVPLRLSAAEVGAWHLRRRAFVVAHADGQRLRDLSRRWVEAAREVAAEPLFATAVGANAANDDGVGELQSQGSVVGKWRRDRDGAWWGAEPDVDRVVHGVPRGVDRRRALGNAVVPQVAEVIGRAIVAADLGTGTGGVP